MISIIVCSVSPDKLSKLKANVEATIGVEYEFVVVDNREGKYSICQAYNIGAQRAKYPYLCFAHEDIAFVVKHHWGELMMAQLAKPDTGVIGFAGATGKTKTLSTWVVTSEYVRSNFNEVVDGNTKIEQTNPHNEDFSQVITLDGLCLFMRRQVWQENQFDSEMLTGFHLYDLDISVAVAQKYKNYVCHKVLVEHFSKGAFSKKWMNESLKFHKKWQHQLPLYVDSDVPMAENEKLVMRRMTYFLLKRKLLPKAKAGEMVKLCRRTFPWRVGSYYLWIRYLCYKKDASQ